MRTYQEMNEYYVDMSLQDIQKQCHDEKDRMDDATEKLTEGLLYLRRSKRFKKDRRYVNSSFGEYLLHEYQIDEKKQFDVWCTAYQHYPEEAKEVGPSLVLNIKKKCGHIKVAPVVEEIKIKQQEIGKRLPLTSRGNHPSIEKIIEPHKKSIPEKPKSTLRKDFKDSQEKLVITEKSLHETQDELDEKTEQVNKLKKTVIEMKKPVEIEEEITEDTLLSYFEKKIGKVFTQEDYDLLKKYF
jgi:hypothetical protein